MLPRNVGSPSGSTCLNMEKREAELLVGPVSSHPGQSHLKHLLQTNEPTPGFSEADIGMKAKGSKSIERFSWRQAVTNTSYTFLPRVLSLILLIKSGFWKSMWLHNLPWNVPLQILSSQLNRLESSYINRNRKDFCRMKHAEWPRSQGKADAQGNSRHRALADAQKGSSPFSDSGRQIIGPAQNVTRWINVGRKNIT